MEPPHRPRGAAVLTDPELDAALLAGLAPRGLAERARVRLGGGYTALQVWQRAFPDATPADDPVETRRAVARVAQRLFALAARGAVEHSRTRMSVFLNTKGPRDVEVDVFRLAGRGLRRG